MRFFLAISTIMSALLLSCQLALHDCRTSVDDRLQIPNSPWEVLHWSRSCGGLDAGTTYMVAKNRVTGEVIHLVDLPGGDSDIKLSIDTTNRLIMIFPAIVQVTNQHDSFDGIPVIYEFRQTEGEDNNGYRFWLDHHNDPEAIAWCRSKGWGHFYCDPR